jgi:hypothetical protein
VAWTLLPVAANAPILKAQFDEVRAAIIERRDACGLVWAVTAATADGAQLRALLTEYRTKIETLIPYFWNPLLAWFGPFTKTACLNKALGHPNWTANQVPAWMFVDEINELRLVVNELLWRRLTPTGTDEYTNQTLGAKGTSNVSLNAAWADLAINYPPAVYNPNPAYFGLGWWRVRNVNIVPFLFAYDVEHYRSADFLAVIPNKPVSAVKMCFYVQGYGADVTFSLFNAAGYAGVDTPLVVSGANPGSYVSVDLPLVVPGATQHYSIRTNPAAEVLDNYRPGPVVGNTKGASANAMNLLVRHTFVCEG